MTFEQFWKSQKIGTAGTMNPELIKAIQEVAEAAYNCGQESNVENFSDPNKQYSDNDMKLINENLKKEDAS